LFPQLVLCSGEEPLSPMLQLVGRDGLVAVQVEHHAQHVHRGRVEAHIHDRALEPHRDPGARVDAALDFDRVSLGHAPLQDVAVEHLEQSLLAINACPPREQVGH